MKKTGSRWKKGNTRYGDPFGMGSLFAIKSIKGVDYFEYVSASTKKQADKDRLELVKKGYATQIKKRKRVQNPRTRMRKEITEYVTYFKPFKKIRKW